MRNFQSTQFNSSSVINGDNKNDIIPYLDETFYKNKIQKILMDIYIGMILRILEKI